MSAAHGSIALIEDRCTSCMICARECPTDALEWGGARVPSADRLVDLVHGRSLLAPRREAGE